jgi:motility quorum-sensing regulator / GCU-specific mRNA interferase toxin
MGATYSLDAIQSRLKEGKFVITQSGLQGALQIGFDGEDIAECICEELRGSHFYKTMPADKRPGMWQDVYRIFFRGKRVYLKVQMNARGYTVIVSFKEDTSP